MRALDGGGLSGAVRTGQPYPRDYTRPADFEAVWRLTAGLVVDEMRTILVSGKARTAAQPDEKPARDGAGTDPDPRGMVIRGLRIDGLLDLDGASAKVGLRMVGCLLVGGISLQDATLPWLELVDCAVLGALAADRSQIGWVTIRHCVVRASDASPVVSFAEAKIAHDLRFDATRVGPVRPMSNRPRAWAIDLAGASIGGALSLACAEATAYPGAVRATGAAITGSLDARGAILTGVAGPALLADYMSVGYDAFLVEDSDVMTATGEGPAGAISLVGATITGRTVLRRATLTNASGPALIACQAAFKEGLLLDSNFTATACSGDTAAVDLRGAAITGPLALTRARITNSGPEASNAAAGSSGAGAALCLSSATVSGRFPVSGATITSAQAAAVMADYVTINGDAFICEADTGGLIASGGGRLGVICLIGATVNGQLSLRGSRVTWRVGDTDPGGQDVNPADVIGTAILADLLTVKGATRIDGGVVCHGAVQLWGATLSGMLRLEPQELVYAGPATDRSAAAVWLTGATIGDEMLLKLAPETLHCPTGPLVLADDITVNGDAHISWTAEPAESGGPSVSLQHATVSKRLTLAGVTPNQDVNGTFRDLVRGLVKARRERVRRASAQPPPAPAATALDLDGITFTGMPSLGSKQDRPTVERWLWVLERARYAPQPYHALSTAYEGIGDDDAARRLLIAQRDRALVSGPLAGTRFWYEVVLRSVIGYGYRSTWAIRWLIVLLAITLGVSLFILRPNRDIVPMITTTTPTKTVTVSLPTLTATTPTQKLTVTTPAGTTTTTTLAKTSGVGRAECSVPATFDYAISVSFPIVSLTSDDPNCGAYNDPSFWVVLFSWVGRALSVILAGFFVTGLTGITTRSPSGFS